MCLFEGHTEDYWVEMYGQWQCRWQKMWRQYSEYCVCCWKARAQCGTNLHRAANPCGIAYVRNIKCVHIFIITFLDAFCPHNWSILFTNKFKRIWKTVIKKAKRLKRQKHLHSVSTLLGIYLAYFFYVLVFLPIHLEVWHVVCSEMPFWIPLLLMCSYLHYC